MSSEPLVARRPLRELDSILDPVSAYRLRVEALLQECVASGEIPVLRSVLESVLHGPAKRLRPAITLLVGLGYGFEDEDLSLLAAGVEVLHSATLVHDDIVDEADSRRGRPAVHMAWSDKVAILAGDYLFATSADMVARLDRPKIVRQFADTIRLMSRSEFVAPVFESDPGAARVQYLEKIGNKTASLIALSCSATGSLVDVDETSAAALHKFGWALGVAFQITDDVLDVTGESNETGKPVGGDLRAGILTLPTIEYMECVAEPHSSLRKVAGGEPVPEAEVSSAIQLLHSSGAVVAARGVAEEFAVQARAALERLPANQAFDALADLVTYATDRSR